MPPANGRHGDAQEVGQHGGCVQPPHVLLALDHSQLLPELRFPQNSQATFRNRPPGGIIQKLVCASSSGNSSAPMTTKSASLSGVYRPGVPPYCRTSCWASRLVTPPSFPTNATRRPNRGNASTVEIWWTFRVDSSTRRA